MGTNDITQGICNREELQGPMHDILPLEVREDKLRGLRRSSRQVQERCGEHVVLDAKRKMGFKKECVINCDKCY